MSIQVINENDYIKDSREVINSNFAELNTNKAPLDSPALTGNPTAPTQTATDNSTKLATTEFVKSNVPASVGDSDTPVYTDSNGKVVTTGKKFSDYVKLTGDETVAGTKTFSSVPVITGSLNDDDNSQKAATTQWFQNFGSGAGYHNSIFRGKSLGSSVTSDQWAEIKAGTFKNLFIGDYWTINSITWRIAAFDYWLKHGDTECTTHHVVIVPDSNLASCKMNDSNITTGAYVGSDYYTGNNSNTGKATAQTAINNAFGSGHILSHKEYLKNAVTNGYESAGAWYASTFELMTEQMVYGCKVFGNCQNGTNLPASYTIDNAQLPLFRLNHAFQCNRANWWLRDVASASYFALVGSNGNCSYDSASDSCGVRPAFGIYQS